MSSTQLRNLKDCMSGNRNQGESDSRVEVAAETLRVLTAEIIRCRRCPRLVEHRERIGEIKRASYKDWDYWARPVPASATRQLRLWSWDWHRQPMEATGPAECSPAMRRPRSSSRPCTRPDWRTSRYRTTGRTAGIHGGLRLRRGACVPPGDRPTPEEQRTCLPYLAREMRTAAQPEGCAGAGTDSVPGRSAGDG